MNLKEKLQSYLSPSVFRFLIQAGQIAASRNVELFLIGGSVRELLLSHPENIDIDLVVEGLPGSHFARLLQRTFGGKVSIFDKYGTAKIQIPALPAIDIAASRTEAYAFPGAPPEVTLSSLKADLDRRDFSINAMAIALIPQRFGELIDFFKGREDLTACRLRVLHPEKFKEDPVRIWRACRFEITLGFKMDPESEQLAATAMHIDNFKGFITIRIKEEIKKILGMNDPLPCLRRLEQLQVLNCIDPDVHLNRQKEISLKKVLDYHQLFEVNEYLWLVRFNVLIHHLPLERQNLIYQQLNLSRKKQKIVDALKALRQLLGDNESKIKSNKGIYWLFDGKNPESMLSLLSETNNPDLEGAILKYWRSLRHIQPEVSGNILKEWGVQGAMIGHILKNLRNARLEGHIQNKEEEMELARLLVSQLKI